MYDVRVVYFEVSLTVATRIVTHREKQCSCFQRSEECEIEERAFDSSPTPPPPGPRENYAHIHMYVQYMYTRVPGRGRKLLEILLVSCHVSGGRVQWLRVVSPPQDGLCGSSTCNVNVSLLLLWPHTHIHIYDIYICICKVVPLRVFFRLWTTGNTVDTK